MTLFFKKGKWVFETSEELKEDYVEFISSFQKINKYHVHDLNRIWQSIKKIRFDLNTPYIGLDMKNKEVTWNSPDLEKALELCKGCAKMTVVKYLMTERDAQLVLGFISGGSKLDICANEEGEKKLMQVLLEHEVSQIPTVRAANRKTSGLWAQISKNNETRKRLRQEIDLMKTEVFDNKPEAGTLDKFLVEYEAQSPSCLTLEENVFDVSEILLM